jgi:GT2 family glycosyltransferase
LNRILANTSVMFRKLVLRALLLVPEGIRSHLSRSHLLTSIFEFFDRAKYEPVLDAEAWARQKSNSTGQPRSIPMADYQYLEPKKADTALFDAGHESEPVFSILLPVYNTPEEWLSAAVQSVVEQWYPHWELLVVDDCSDSAATRKLLDSLDDPRIRVQRLETNQNIVGASNVALGMARGEYIVLMDHDDELTPNALYEAAKAIEEQGAEFIYSDEDKLDGRGKSCDPHFKPDFAPDQLLSQNYVSHLGVIKRSLVEQAGGFTPGTDGAQDYDLYLKVLELTDKVVHIPRVLYHWRKVPGSTAAFFSEKSYAQDAGKKALAAAVERRGLDAEVEDGRFPGTYRVRYSVQGDPLVSIVIPFKDKPELLDLCLGSILEKSTWRNFEVIGVSNNSESAETYVAMRRWAEEDERIRFVEHNIPFNFSEVNNFAVREHARGEHVILLNNDIEITSPGWIEALLEFSQRADVGAVGGRLLYPDGSLQHAGIILGIGGVAGHSHKYFDGNDHGYFSRPHIIQNVSAVTAACLMVKRALYTEVSGLDEENLQVAFNDVDFCLRLRELGLLNVYTPYCEAVHHESISRGYEDTTEKQQRFRNEVLYMMKRHRDVLEAGDPYYNPNLTLEHENFMLSGRVLNPDD